MVNADDVDDDIYGVAAVGSCLSKLAYLDNPARVVDMEDGDYLGGLAVFLNALLQCGPQVRQLAVAVGTGLLRDRHVVALRNALFGDAFPRTRRGQVGASGAEDAAP